MPIRLNPTLRPGQWRNVSVYQTSLESESEATRKQMASGDVLSPSPHEDNYTSIRVVLHYERSAPAILMGESGFSSTLTTGLLPVIVCVNVLKKKMRAYGSTARGDHVSSSSKFSISYMWPARFAPFPLIHDNSIFIFTSTCINSP